MKLNCPVCGERAYRVYLQEQGEDGSRPWIPMLAFVYCRSEKAIVRLEDHRKLKVRPHDD